MAALVTIAVGWLAFRAAFRKWIRQREKEAVDKADLSKAILGNIEATKANTEALGKLGQDFHDFAGETRSQLNGHAERIGRLERP